MSSDLKPKNISEYINLFPEDTQSKLYEILQCLRNAAPDAEDGLKWGQPALSYDWILFQFAAFKEHVSLYPTPSVIKAFKDELSEYKTTSGTIQFSLNKPLPLDLISKIASFRVQEAKSGVKWK